MRQADLIMDEKRFRLIELDSDNIGSFDLYIPKKTALLILREGVFGIGVLEGNYVSGLILAEKMPHLESLRIIWLYVDEEVRGLGLADALFEKALENYKEAKVIFMQYFYPLHEKAEEYFLHKGFETFTKDSSKIGADEEIHMALKRCDDEPLPFGEEQALFMAPDLGWQLPRLLVIGEYLHNMGFESDVVISSQEEPFIPVNLKGQDRPVKISVIVEDRNSEEYTLVLRKKAREREEDAMIMVPVSEGIIEQQEFEDIWNCLNIQ